MNKRLLLLDNNDSFTYNLVESIRQTSELEIEVSTPSQLRNTMRPFPFDGMIISPGPGLPEDSDLLLDIISDHAGHFPILGVCLGLQALLVSEEVALRQLSAPLHGQRSTLQILDRTDELYQGLSLPVEVGHYHSWYALPGDCPQVYLPTAIDQEGRLMSIRHRHFPIWAVQYHPESFLCPQGDKIIANFLKQM